MKILGYTDTRYNSNDGYGLKFKQYKNGVLIISNKRQEMSWMCNNNFDAFEVAFEREFYTLSETFGSWIKREFFD